MKKNFNMFSIFSCCTGSNEKSQITLNLSIQDSFRADSVNINNLKNYLNEKLGFIIIYSEENNLKIFNEIKKDNEINNILLNSYQEIYRKKTCIFAKSLLEYLEIKKLYENFESFSILLLIITLKREKLLNPNCLLSCLIDKNVNENSIKEIIKLNQYKNFSMTPEPIDNNNNRIVKIKFIIPDENQTILERNFLKEDLIDSLYKFVKYTNIGYDFDLIQGFPYKIYNKMTNTLEQEGLYPSSVIHIRKK